MMLLLPISIIDRYYLSIVTHLVIKTRNEMKMSLYLINKIFF